jgi:hypothetical protein
MYHIPRRIADGWSKVDNKRERAEHIVELLIVDVDFAHLGLHTPAGLGLERHVCFLFFGGITLRRNVHVGDVGRKLKGGFSISRLADGCEMLSHARTGAAVCHMLNSAAPHVELRRHVEL